MTRYLGICRKSTIFAIESMIVVMERFFNTAGPQTPRQCYTIDPLRRIDLDDILTLIRQERYFVLHAPRQTGKTTCLLALRDYLNQHGEYVAVYANVEGGQSARNDVERVIKATCDTIAQETRLVMKDDMSLAIREKARKESVDSMLTTFLRMLSENLPRPFVLFIDEIDALVMYRMLLLKKKTTRISCGLLVFRDF